MVEKCPVNRVLLDFIKDVTDNVISHIFNKSKVKSELWLSKSREVRSSHQGRGYQDFTALIE